MVDVQEISPRAGDVLLMVGTTKGAFLFRAPATRRRFERGGPHFAGHAVYAMAYDGRAGRRRVWAAPESSHWGSVMRSSDDFGRTWSDGGEATVRFPEDTGKSLQRIWAIAGRDDDPQRMYCGVEPAALFESKDAGATWSLVRGLFEHPHRARWEPGGGGLCLHTVLPHPTDPLKVHVAISTAGVYRTVDGGATWSTAHRGVRADFLPDKHPEFGQCVHKVVRHPERPEVMFLQNHWGLYRSDDEGESWTDVARDVPSDFGFAMAMHPHAPDTVYIVPLESDTFRCTPEGRLRVYRTQDGARSWEPLARGLPQQNAFETILRDALCTDHLPQAGVYFGTRSGKVFASANGGERWRLVADGLPPVLCVRAAVVAPSRRSRL
jgi:photosystem II stability/assembly factor-like uncharacterized protein